MIWACEYSPVQQTFHVDTLDRVLETNRRTAEQGVNPGFVVLYVGLTQEDASTFAEQWRREHGR